MHVALDLHQRGFALVRVDFGEPFLDIEIAWLTEGRRENGAIRLKLVGGIRRQVVVRPCAHAEMDGAQVLGAWLDLGVDGVLDRELGGLDLGHHDVKRFGRFEPRDGVGQILADAGRHVWQIAPAKADRAGGRLRDGDAQGVAELVEREEVNATLHRGQPISTM